MLVILESVLLIFLLTDSDLNDPLYIFSLRRLSFLTKVSLKQKVIFFETHFKKSTKCYALWQASVLSLIHI